MPARRSTSTATTSKSKYHDEFDAWEAAFVNPFDDLRGRLRVPQLGQRGAVARARGRRRRRRGALPEHHPAVLPVGEPAGTSTRRRRVRAAVGRAAGAQPLDGRLLRRHAGPPRRHGADLPQRRRRRGRRDRVGGRARACSAASCCRACRPTRTLPPLYARDYDPIWAACEDHDHADQQPQRRRRARARARRHRHGRVHGGAGVVLAPRVLAHGHSAARSPATRASS